MRALRKNRRAHLLGAALAGLAPASLTWPVLAYAQAATEPIASIAAQAVALTAGEIKKIDLDAGKLTIKHGEIKNLEMPPMTMVFVAKDRSQLSPLKVGDKINFLVLHEAGKFVAADIQAAQ